MFPVAVQERMFDCVLPIYIFLPLMALSWTSLLCALVCDFLAGGTDVGSGNVQDEGSVGGDEAREATVTVGVVAVQ